MRSINEEKFKLIKPVVRFQGPITVEKHLITRIQKINGKYVFHCKPQDGLLDSIFNRNKNRIIIGGIDPTDVEIFNSIDRGILSPSREYVVYQDIEGRKYHRERSIEVENTINQLESQNNLLANQNFQQSEQLEITAESNALKEQMHEHVGFWKKVSNAMFSGRSQQ